MIFGRSKKLCMPNISAPPVQKFSCKKKNPLPSPYKEGKKKILNPEVYFDEDDGNNAGKLNVHIKRRDKI